MGELAGIWENLFLRAAAILIAVGVIWRGLVHLVRGVRNAARIAKVAADEFQTLRDMLDEAKTQADETNQIVRAELTDDGNGSTKNKVAQMLDRMGGQDDQLSALKGDVAALQESSHSYAEALARLTAESEVEREHTYRELRKQGIDISPLEYRERWKWVADAD